jgi:pimeloyl-ACP methyl ester carboxylesterase
MTVVLVHGVPETASIWDDLLATWGRTDVVPLSPPGFGAPVPRGFDATSDAYAAWLVGEIERLATPESPVDLIGHDWGGMHVVRAATRRPDLVRTLVTDIGGAALPDYVWHDAAQRWQAPGDGEAVASAMSALSADDRTSLFTGLGMSPGAARACAEANGDVMGACILALYRSAVQPNMGRWGGEYASLPDRPHTVVIAAHDDPYVGGPDAARRTAGWWGADVVEFDGLGHWWMMQDPPRVVRALDDALR